MTFRLAPLSAGANPLYWNTLQDLIGVADIPIQPDASYLPYTEPIDLASGKKRGNGFPAATWLLSGINGEQRYVLRQICPGASADVYIETLTNDYDVSGNRTWIQAQAIMYWPEGEEDIQADMTSDMEIHFSFLEAI